MGPMIKIFLVNALIVTSIFYAETQGALSLIINNDASYLSILIMALYICTSGFLGVISYRADVANKEQRRKLLDRLDGAHFVAEHLISLGLLGTVIGLAMATNSSLVEGAVIDQIVSGLKTGLSVAFYSTMTGLVTSMLLQLQLLILTRELKE
jgi:putative copper export protein